MDKYGDARMKLALFVRDNVLDQLNIPWTIENGTLLGAWRNGKFILHDDDFDIALFFETDPIPRVPAMLNKVQQLLPAPYKARYVSSYADKIEVYDPTYGEYSLLGPKIPRRSLSSLHGRFTVLPAMRGHVPASLLHRSDHQNS